MTFDAMTDRLLIREVVENWVLWRDSGRWEAFADVWHPDGIMMATWQQSRADAFIEGCKAGWARGLKVLHVLGGSTVAVTGERAIAQTKMTIHQRAEVHGTLVDVACMGRFYDFFEHYDGRWVIQLRQPIYERDRMDPVDPSAALTLDAALLGRFPEGYRHLAYLQTQQGFTVSRDMPGVRGPEVEALYARGAAWLAGAWSPVAD